MDRSPFFTLSNDYGVMENTIQTIQIGLGSSYNPEDMLTISFDGLGSTNRGEVFLWQITCLTLIWIVWQERNAHIFEDK